MSDLQVHICHRVAAFSLGALLATQAVESFIQAAPWFIWLVRLLPLLIFVPGMRADKLRSYIWLCFVCLLYFMMLVLRLFADPTNMVSVLGMVSVVSLFVSAMLYVRWRARQLRKGTSDD
ncbi:MAG: DUF2069 domain-containing protein [Gammaproteobacteria bacterium]|nr:DUF2069 domain-containing protein [Gammaproteobacteria bacterium]